jgi:hypothetical protein
MMPTSPSSPLKFRTAGFPQYGFKAGLSGGAFPDGTQLSRRLGLLPPFAHPVSRHILPVQCRAVASVIRRRSSDHCRSTPGALAPVRVMLSRPIITYQPHPPHSPAHRDFAAWRFIRGAFAVLSPRRPVSGSGLSLQVLRDMPSSSTPGSPSAACTQFLHRRCCPSPSVDGLGAPNAPTIRFRWAEPFGASWFALATACHVACLSGGSDQVSLADRDFYVRASDGSVTLPAAGYNYGGNWVIPPAGLSPAGLAASLAAPTLGSGWWPPSAGRDWVPAGLRRKVSEITTTSLPPSPGFAWRTKAHKGTTSASRRRTRHRTGSTRTRTPSVGSASARSAGRRS